MNRIPPLHRKSATISKYIKQKWESLTAGCSNESVVVRRRWNSDESLAVNIEDLWDFHFQNDAGGVCRALPRAFLGARAWCDKIDAGVLRHFCKEGPPPHEIAVCILPTDNPILLYEKLRERAKR